VPAGQARAPLSVFPRLPRVPPAHTILSVITTSFRVFLRSELARRCANNPRYSLRAFARHLEVDHATLSQWMRGRRAMSAASIQRLAARLRVPARHVGVFVEHRGSEGADFAVLALVRSGAFRPDARWIARELGITVDATNVALHRLLRLELLRMTAPDCWTATEEGRGWDAR
jgi:transcriptional regulator with XRE-family HTH domain